MGQQANKVWNVGKMGIPHVDIFAWHVTKLLFHEPPQIQTNHIPTSHRLIDRQPTLSVIEDLNLCITEPLDLHLRHVQDNLTIQGRFSARFPRDPARTPNALGLAGCRVVLILCMIHIIGVACRCEALLG